MEKKIIRITQEPGGVRDATLYRTEANVWYDEGETRFRLEETSIGDPPHVLIYKEEGASIDSKLLDIGHGLEEASEKAYSEGAGSL